MPAAGSPADEPDRFGRLASLTTTIRVPIVATLALSVLAVEPALATIAGVTGEGQVP